MVCQLLSFIELLVLAFLILEEGEEIVLMNESGFFTQVQETRDLLGSHLHLYQIHSATVESGVLDNDQVLAELAQVKVDKHFCPLGHGPFPRCNPLS